jgi:hypothetical protein
VGAFDSQNLKLLNKWPPSPCKPRPGDGYGSHKYRRLFIGCRSQLVAMVNADAR